MGTMEQDPFVALRDDLSSASVDNSYSPPPSSGMSSIGQRRLAPEIGSFCGFQLDEQPLVCLCGEYGKEIVPARSVVRLCRDMLGADVLVLFENGDFHRPLIVGVVQTRIADECAATPALPVTVDLDGERLLLSAEREITLRCGDSSITLTRAGKIIIKGNYILSRSTGYNKIKGAAVDIN
ncbi:DUF6484 domain-containing protein [Chitinivorax sp. PXF-14]|uniref:DUF6484 domain-containing protein n=1 Tax=Chitinivorax sp. PXF-14 TaxID=3230488 RepID=UPI0034670D7D